MPPISKEKTDKIKEQIIHILFYSFPFPLFTHDIAKEIARDEEFTKKILLEMENQKILVKVNKTNKGKKYKKRCKWRLSNFSYEIFKSKIKNE